MYTQCTNTVYIYIYTQCTNVMRASHSKKLLSLLGPATIPSGGLSVSSTQEKRIKGKESNNEITFVLLNEPLKSSHLYMKDTPTDTPIINYYY